MDISGKFMKSVSFSEVNFLNKVMCKGKFFVKVDLCSALTLLGIVSKINGSNWFSGETNQSISMKLQG